MSKLTLVVTPAVLAVFASPLIAAYLDGPPPAHTGGFGEPTCTACHFGADLNDRAGALTLAGVPGHYTPRQQYLLTITLGREGMARGGFQIAARFAAGAHAGGQAGTLTTDGKRVEVAPGGAPSVQYAQHTAVGAEIPDCGPARWQVEWTAPEAGGGEVVFHVAGNAANADDSAFGDYIYTTLVTSAAADSADPENSFYFGREVRW